MNVFIGRFGRRALAVLLSVMSVAAHAGFAPAPPPATKVCPDGATILASATCTPQPGTANPGVSDNTLSRAASDLLGSIGGIVGGALGSGGPVAAAGTQRFALSGQTGQAAAAGGANWHAWAALSHTNVGYSFAPLQSSGRSNLTLGGIDYTFGNSVVLGLAVADERTRVDTTFNGGRISGNGTSFLPYLGWRIDNAWLFDASLGYGTTNLSSTDNSIPGGITGSNKATRNLGSMGLAYNRVVGRWLLTGKASLLSVDNSYSAFTFSNGNAVAASGSRTTQMRLGAQATYNAGSVSPFFGLAYINDIDRANQAAVAGQSAANDRDAWQLRLGLNFRSAGALYGGIQLSSEVGRSQVKNDQLLLNVGLRF